MGLHLLVNNAGTSGPVQPVGEYPLDGCQQVIDVNLTGVFHGMRFGLPEMVKAGGGAIVNMASILGSVVLRRPVLMSPRNMGLLA
nr:SDR family oxidoreductase [Rhodobacter sp. NTK016B]